MLPRILFYCVAIVCAWAALQGTYLTYQAHQLLSEPHNIYGAVVLAAASALVLTSAVLAALRRRSFYAPVFMAALLTPAFIVVGLAQMGDMPVSQAYAQATCAKGVGVCFTQAASFLKSVAVAAFIGGAFLIYLFRSSRSEA
jgi:hypothetical protein